MKFFVLATVFLVGGQCVENCPKLKAPKFGTMLCSFPTNGKAVCTFSCKHWTTMIGKDEVSCDEDAPWDAMVPLCYPNYTKCSKKHKDRCPKISAEDMERVAEIGVPEKKEEEKKAINQIIDEFLSLKMARKANTLKCSPQMCKVKCIHLKYRKLANRCARCKKRKIVKCGRGGGLFLN